MSGTVNLMASYTIVSSGGSIKHRDIYIDSTKCGTVDSSSWTVLISCSDATIKSVANGGNVHRADGYDINFFSDSGHTTLLNWEVWNYDPIAGTLVAWIQLPTVSHSTNTYIYMQYGSSSITTFQGGAYGSAWNSNFVTVYPLYEQSNPYSDKTTNNNGSSAGTYPSQTPGKIYKGQSFNGSSNYIVFPNTAAMSVTNLTVNCWVNHTTNNTNYETITSKRAATSSSQYEVGLDISSHNVYLWSNPPGTYSASTTALTNGTWQMLTVTSGTSGGSAFYLNGASSSTTTINVGTSNSNDLVVGSAQESAGQFFNGKVEFLTVSNVKWTTSNITTMYNNTNSPGNIGSASFLTYGSEY